MSVLTTVDEEYIAVRVAEEQLRAQIRDAAIAQFGSHGFRTTLRTVADAAGISNEVLLDLFGSKRNLLRTCDDYIVETVRASKTQALQSHDPETWLAALSEIESFAPLMAYLVRSIENGQRLGNDLLDRMIENAVDYLDDGVRAGAIKPSRDPRARATFIALNNAGGFLLYRHRHPTPGGMAAVLRDYAADMVGPALELYTEGLLADTAMLQTFQAGRRNDGAP
jgi:TetR/AcrR family transcriptional regulator, regulator of cefoperazone and chloramphenicol sensitivity